MMKRRDSVLLMVAIFLVALAGPAMFVLWGEPVNATPAPIGSWSLTLAGTCLVPDDEDYTEDELWTGVYCNVPSGETGAYMAIFFNGSSTAFSTTSVSAGSELYKYHWATGENGDGDPSVGYNYVIKLFNSDDEEMASTDDISELFYRG